MFIDRIRSMREGNVFTGLCQSVHGGRGCGIDGGVCPGAVWADTPHRQTDTPLPPDKQIPPQVSRHPHR